MLGATQGSITTTVRLLFQLKLALVLFEKIAQILRSIQEFHPLLVIERDRETAKSVDGDSASCFRSAIAWLPFRLTEL
jgi:hypothetical protein